MLRLLYGAFDFESHSNSTQPTNTFANLILKEGIFHGFGGAVHKPVMFIATIPMDHKTNLGEHD